MIRFRKLLCVLLAAAVLPGMLAGCRKSDGTEVFPTETVPVPENPKADEQDKSFTSIAVSEFAKTDAPFPLDDAQRPQQGIVMVMIFDDTEMKLNHKPEIVKGVLEKECASLLSDFFKELRNKNKSGPDPGNKDNNDV